VRDTGRDADMINPVRRVSKTTSREPIPALHGVGTLAHWPALAAAAQSARENARPPSSAAATRRIERSGTRCPDHRQILSRGSNLWVCCFAGVMRGQRDELGKLVVGLAEPQQGDDDSGLL
jgi:hypothetical protein